MISSQTEFFSLFCFARLPVPPDRFCAENRTPEYFLQKAAVHRSCDEAETCCTHSRCKLGVTESNPGIPSHTGAAPTPSHLHHRRQRRNTGHSCRVCALFTEQRGGITKRSIAVVRRPSWLVLCLPIIKTQREGVGLEYGLDAG